MVFQPDGLSFTSTFQGNIASAILSGSNVADFFLQPGANAIPGGHYAELDCFGNTFYLDGNQANQDAGISQLESEYFVLVPGDNDITIAGATTDVLWQAAWA